MQFALSDVVDPRQSFCEDTDVELRKNFSEDTDENILLHF